MKIYLNPIQSYNKSHLQYNQNRFLENPIENSCNTEYSVLPSYSLAMFPNITFRNQNGCKELLISYGKKINCAYSGMPMLTKEELELAYKNLKRKHSCQSALGYLQQFEGYMHPIEHKVFQKFMSVPNKEKQNFNKILKQLEPEALINLKKKQLDVMHSADNIIETMTKNTKKKVKEIRDTSINRIVDDSFSRQAVLELIKGIKAKGADLSKVIQVYQSWYKLPNSQKDLDAFVVKYSKKSHLDIAKRLICSAEATIEHVVPSSRKGEDNLKNYILVSAGHNSARHSMPLSEFIMLNNDINIKENLQKYLNSIIKEVNNPNSELSTKHWYPEAIKHTVEKETKHAISLDTSQLQKCSRKRPKKRTS